MYMSDEDGDEFEEVCLPVNLEDDGYNMIHTHDDYAAFILAGGGCRVLLVWLLGAGVAGCSLLGKHGRFSGVDRCAVLVCVASQQAGCAAAAACSSQLMEPWR